MNILWIEDGKDLEPAKAASEICKDFIDNGKNFKANAASPSFKEYLERQFNQELQTSKIHKLHVCRCYSEWVQENLNCLLDFDAIIIDKNL
ncbi:MAG: hypothetical protein H7A23_05580 [Leptospiraceae bacterium]|nr:hypothetical protein [Leptospiraceae bacterium]MCP5494008.1 hypothetical protein [Leptospiraceae bacterium]